MASGIAFRSSSAVASETTSIQDSREHRLQSEVKARLTDELRGAVFTADLTNFLPVKPNILSEVTNRLDGTLLDLTSGGASSPDNPRFLADGFHTEPESYKPLEHFLNKILDTANRTISLSDASPISGLRFHVFGKHLKEAYDSGQSLKPDLVGITIPLPKETRALSWGKVEVAVECKSSVKEMVRQSATYARCCLIANQRRFFALAIGFQYKSLEAYLFVFHRSGLSSSLPLAVATTDGFNSFVRHILGILSSDVYGLDPTRTEDVFCINNRHYEIVRVICQRHSLRGRCTAVYSLQGM
jgi:hypothetical protein